MKTLCFHDYRLSVKERELLVLDTGSQPELAFGPGIHLILAPNGTGKSTFLRTLAGSARPSRGRATWSDGSSWDASHDALYVSEYLSFPKFVYPTEWISFAAGTPWTTLAERLKDWIGRFGLVDQMSRFLGRMSQGERRKVTWLAAHASTAQVLLLDEPLDGVDLLAVQAARDSLAMWKEQGRIVLLIAHQAAEILDLCDNVWWIQDRKFVLWNRISGKSPAQIDPRELREQTIRAHSPARLSP